MASPHLPAAGVSRRRFLGAAGALVAGGALAGAGASVELTQGLGAQPGVPDQGVLPFYGEHQAGVVTPPQRHSYFAALDVTTNDRGELAALMKRWSALASRLCQGDEVGAGEAAGLGAARLSVNFGFGPSLFGVGAPDRFGLRAKWPMALVQVPRDLGDRIAPSQAGGDFTLHACANDPQVAFHAVHQLLRTAEGTVSLRWAQAGFNEQAATGSTARDLIGFKDGTVNPATPAQLADFVWVGSAQDQDWMVGGTYLVARRIRVLLVSWDDLSTTAQEAVIGRHKASGAPLGREHEDDALDLGARYPDGRFVIPPDAHVRLASAAENWGQMLLRRSYAYNNGASPPAEEEPSRSSTAGLDAGLLFYAYQQDPRLAFIPIYAKLARRDALRHFTLHTASAVSALPPGARGPDEYVGQGLFG